MWHNSLVHNFFQKKYFPLKYGGSEGQIAFSAGSHFSLPTGDEIA
jgi:hypothetical protein